MPQVKVECLPVGPIAANCYLVENLDNGQLLVVDPGAEAQRIMERIGGRQPVAALLTHGHFDHIGGADALCQHYQIPLYVHEADAPKLPDPALNESAGFGENVSVMTKPVTFRDGDELTLGGIPLKVIGTPGHSKGSCCFLLPEDQGILTGDTLFAGGYGRYDFADSDFLELKNSLHRLFLLTPKQIAYPGHGDKTVTGRDGEGKAL